MIDGRIARTRTCAAASLGTLLLVSGLLAAVLIGLLAWPGDRPTGDLRLFCAAGMRVPMEQIIADFQQETGVRVDAQFEGSHDLLNKLKIYRVGDVYLAGDNSYIEQAVAEGLVREGMTIARMKPVIVVQRGSDAEKTVRTIGDLLAPGLRLSIGDPDKAAVGRKTKKLLGKSGHWPRLAARVAENGATWGTVNDAANAVKIGSVDAAIVWDAVARLPNYRQHLQIVEVPELDAGEATVTLGVCDSSQDRTTAYRFARYVTASDRGLPVFKQHGWRTAAGDPWAWNPTLHIYSGGVNRLAIESTIHDWADREGVNLSTTFLGCGQLVSDMKAIRGGGKNQMFPAAYFACDLSYMEQVQGEFEDPVNLTSTKMVLLVHPEAREKIQSIQDLSKPGIRFGLADKQFSALGLLTERLLMSAGIWHRIPKDNFQAWTHTADMLVNQVKVGGLDAAIVYLANTTKVQDDLVVRPIEHAMARAIQPYAVAKDTPYKRTLQRLMNDLLSKQMASAFEQAGFRRLTADR